MQTCVVRSIVTAGKSEQKDEEKRGVRQNETKWIAN